MGIMTPESYRALSETTIATYLDGLPAIRERLGGSSREWRTQEVGDGNLNLVFIVEGPTGDVCVKQALPYVRLVGDSWPLPLERAWYEHQALCIHDKLARRYIPEVLHFDEELFLIVMERLTPHIIMRRGMIQGRSYPRFAEHITDFLARILYCTSDLALTAADKKVMIGRFSGNTELCKITEDLIFTDPYMVHERNRWTSPQLDDVAAAIRDDARLKVRVAELKLKFMSEAQALLHGDLHTGSIMVTEDDTRVIDPEFAFVGPIGFDVGKLLGNLLMCFFSQDGHESKLGEREPYREWTLSTVTDVWRLFEEKFLALWRDQPTGDAYPRPLFTTPADEAALTDGKMLYMRRLFEDALAYAGTSMIRRVLGLAHNADFERIENADRRAACERRNLQLARELILGAGKVGGIQDVVSRAKEVRMETSQ